MTIPIVPPGALRLWHSELRARYRGQDAAMPSTWRFDVRFWARQGGEVLSGNVP